MLGARVTRWIWEKKRSQTQNKYLLEALLKDRVELEDYKMKLLRIYLLSEFICWCPETWIEEC